MAGYFDDLIPAAPQGAAPAQVAAPGYFDDLIPKGENSSTVVPPTPGRTQITVRPNGMAQPDGVVPQGAQAEQPSVLGDVAKSAGIGVVKGAIGLAGLPGDLTELGARGINRATRFVGDALGIETPKREDQEPTLGSAQITHGVEGITGPLYEPKTTAGDYAQTAGEFVPGLLGGPEGLIAKFGTRAMTRVAIPAIADETAGQLTKGTVAEPYARAAGAILGAGGGALATRGPGAIAPTREALKSAADGDYAVARAMGVEIKPDAVNTFAQGLENDLHAQGLRPSMAPETFAALKEMQAVPNGSVANLADIDGMRGVFRNAAKNFNNPREQMAAGQAITALDRFVERVAPADVLAGDPAAAQRILGDARGNYSAAKLSEAIDKKQVRAEIRAAAANSGQNVSNTMRQRIADILLNPRERRGFSQAELAQMDRIVRGTATGNLSRFAGNMMGGGGGMGAMVAGGLGGMATGGPGFAIPVAGFALKKVADASTMRQVRRLDEMVRSRAPLAKAMPAPGPRQSVPLAMVGAGFLAADQPRGPRR